MICAASKPTSKIRGEVARLATTPLALTADGVGFAEGLTEVLLTEGRLETLLTELVEACRVELL